MRTTVISGDDLSFAAEVILRGGLVAIPTDTIYGLAGNGLDADAVARIYDVKGRPSEKALILLVPGLNTAKAFCAGIPESARILAETFWPGPLSMILPCNDTVPGIVTAGGGTVGLRCPDHPKALELLRLVQVPLAAPSANFSGSPPPKTAQEVLEYFDGRIDCVIDGGRCPLGLESTIVDLTAASFRVLRHGALDEEDIKSCLSSE